MVTNQYPALTLLSNMSAAPSGSLSGSYAQGASEGALLPGQSYGSSANLTGMNNGISGNYQAGQTNTMGAYQIPNVLGAQTQKPPQTPPQNPPPGGNGGAGNNGGNPITGDASARAAGFNDYADYQNKLAAAANSGNAALLSQLNTQFDQNAANAQNQLGFLGTQKDNALSSLNTDFTNTQNTVGGQRSDAQQNADDQISQAGSVAHSTQAQNRNVLRALGILNSSAAGDILTKPMNEFDNQRAAVNTQLGQRFRDLDNFMNGQVAKHQDAVKQIQDNYSNLVGNIQSDLRFNDRQRSDAIQAANAALQQHLSDIQGSMLNYQNQVNQQKQQLALGLAQIMAYRNPSFDPTGILNSAINAGGQGLQGVNIFQDPNQQKKQQTLSGL